MAELAVTPSRCTITELHDRIIGVGIRDVDGIFMVTGRKVAVGHGRMFMLIIAMTVTLRQMNMARRPLHRQQGGDDKNEKRITESGLNHGRSIYIPTQRHHAPYYRQSTGSSIREYPGGIHWLTTSLKSSSPPR